MRTIKAQIESVLYEEEGYRIIESVDEYMDLDDLKGDMYCPLANPDISPEQLRAEEIEFERKVYNEGVYGYCLEKWNPEVGIGWELIDSCWGFVGTHEIENHYIIDEFMKIITNE